MVVNLFFSAHPLLPLLNYLPGKYLSEEYNNIMMVTGVILVLYVISSEVLNRVFNSLYIYTDISDFIILKKFMFILVNQCVY